MLSVTGLPAIVFHRLFSPIPVAFLQSLLSELFLVFGREHPTLRAVKPF